MRIRHELGYNLIQFGGEPWIGVPAIFDVVIKPYLDAGPKTTSSSEVVGTDEPTQAVIKLDDVTGFLPGQRVVVGDDDSQEIVTIQGLTGPLLLASFSKSHNRTYPVTVEGGESIVREILTNIRNCKGRMATSLGTGSLKKADEVEFYQGSGSFFEGLSSQLEYWRDELASALGLRRKSGRTAASRLSVY